MSTGLGGRARHGGAVREVALQGGAMVIPTFLVLSTYRKHVEST